MGKLAKEYMDKGGLVPGTICLKSALYSDIIYFKRVLFVVALYIKYGF